ncbi:MAG: HIT domain-containing protein [Candidatus Cloacimonetes bacterium]|jgi:ATP adenylyltransferase|nr:HIT domain-containing protein [Candidatus Cloacimonadota bacterium]MBT6994943.1 HIT domain-containing protein [Candidatus Cloacimonadota bacterium]MBT7469526.1 HIT domain-containing protein [Candidatus Cloacimonadota bacterium]
MSDKLYSPWRLQYILSEKEKKCIFCIKPQENNDKKHLILHRAKHCFVIMNVFPYNNGHIMVVPNRHISRLNDLKMEELNELFATVQLSEKVLGKVYHCDGFNVGINLGKAGGAGIEEHLHIHIVPRWHGDVNFMTTIGGTRIIPENFEKSFTQLKKQFDNETLKK